MKRIGLLTFICLLTWTATARAVTPAELSNQAQSNYQAGHYEPAIQAWQELTEIGFVNGDIYYNIGSAYWRLGKLGQSRRFFLKAESWSPRDPSIRHNLQFIASKVEKPEAGGVGPLSLIRKIPFYRLALNRPESLVLSALTSVALFSLLLLHRWKRKTAFLVGAVLLIPLLCFGLWQLLLRSDGVWGSQVAVVLSPKISLREDPLPDSLSREELGEGSLVRVQSSQGDFALVKSVSGKEGWVEKSSLGEIE